MAKAMEEKELWELIKRKLQDQGIELENVLEMISKVDEADVAVVCATGDDLGASIEELAGTSRDKVVMVRVDESTLEKLNMWTETGMVKSKSEAAALFIKEGLKVRAQELDELSGAINEVKKAKAHLETKAKKIFGEATEA